MALTTLISLSLQTSFANDIYVSSIGDDVSLELKQQGHDMDVDVVVNGDTNSIKTDQFCTAGTSCVPNNMDITVTGNTNTVWTAQGRHFSSSTSTTLSTDSNEPGGQNLDVTIVGDNNSVKASQRNANSVHSNNMDVDITGNSNSVFANQGGSGTKSLDIDINNDGNTVSNNQVSNAAHSSNITIGGTGPTVLGVTQSGNTAQSYTLNQTCVNQNGCTISVTQQ